MAYKLVDGRAKHDHDEGEGTDGMLYAIYCKDKANHLQTRLDNRPAHVEYLKKFSDQHICTGPLLTDDGQGMVGSLLVMDFADKKAAEDFAAGDPYAKAGLFQSVTITHSMESAEKIGAALGAALAWRATKLLRHGHPNRTAHGTSCAQHQSATCR